MILKSKYDIGDVVFAAYNKVEGPLTIGQVRIEYTDSVGSGNSNEIFDNYKPQKNVKREYMCVETGVGSGSIFDERRLFTTRDAAQAYINVMTEGMADDNP